MINEESPPIDGCSIVLLGSFNPPIFQPSWFALQGIVDREVAEAAEKVHISTDWTFFETRQFGCEVSRERLHIFTTPETSRMELLGQIVTNTFKRLYHTPLATVSMIRFKHVARDWETFAPKLASAARWHTVMGEFPRVDRLVVRSEIAGDPPGVLGFAVEQSEVIDGGIFLSVTHQYTLSEDASKTADAAYNVLSERWAGAIDKGDDIIDLTLTFEHDA